jgi:hypothetical protein
MSSNYLLHDPRVAYLLQPGLSHLHDWRLIKISHRESYEPPAGRPLCAIPGTVSAVAAERASN